MAHNLSALRLVTYVCLLGPFAKYIPLRNQKGDYPPADELVDVVRVVVDEA